MFSTYMYTVPTIIQYVQFNQGLLEEEEPGGQPSLPDSPLGNPSPPSPPAERDLSVKDLFLLRRKKERERYSDVPHKFKGFESLLNDHEDEMDDAPPLPTGRSHDSVFITCSIVVIQLSQHLCSHMTVM